MERIQGFPSDWIKDCLVDGNQVPMSHNKRRFMMGNALVVDLIKQMEPQLEEIISEEPEIGFTINIDSNIEIDYSEEKNMIEE